MSWTLLNRKDITGYLLAIAVLMGPAPARAASPEDDYLKARKSAVAHLLKVERNFSNTNEQTSGERFQHIEASYKSDLERRLRAIIGTVKVRDFVGPGELNLTSLVTDDRDFAKLDGLRLASSDGTGILVVSTPGLARHWATENKEDWNQIFENDPTSIDLMLKSNAFYTWAVTYDRDDAIARFSVLPIAKPKKATTVYAFLGVEGDDENVGAPNKVVVAEIIGNRLLFAVSPISAAITPIESCSRTRSDAKTVFDPVFADYFSTYPRNTAVWAKAHTIKSSFEAAFASCFAKEVMTQSGYPLVLKQAQTLANAMAGE